MVADIIERTHGLWRISTDPSRLDIREIHRFLSEESYWAVGRSFDVQARAIEHSNLVVGAYDEAGDQVGFARMVTDLATFAWLADVYVVPIARGTGLGTAMVQTIVEHPSMVALPRQILATRDAHELYRKVGYQEIDDPKRFMYRIRATR